MVDACPDCGSSTVLFAVPDSLRQYAPADASSGALCTRCLRVHPASEFPNQPPNFRIVSETFPDGEAGVALALAVGKLGSLALNRSAVVALCEHAEREGADALLVLDRLADADVDPHFDLERRRHQVAQYLH